MKIIWKKGFNPNEVIGEIEKNRRVDSSGKVSFEGWEQRNNFYFIREMIEFPPEIIDREKYEIVHNSIFEIGKKSTLTQKNILEEIKKQTKIKLSTQKIDFVLFTTISIPQSEIIGNVLIQDSRIEFPISQPINYLRHSAKIMKEAKNSIYGSIPTNHKYVKVFVKARSFYDASEKALNSLDLYRGIWNFFFNFSQPWRMSFGGKPKPVNKILSGPIHTLHYPNGYLASKDVWWYETSYIESLSPYRIDNIKTDFDKYYKVFKSNLFSSSYSEKLQNCIIRYTRALDEVNFNNAFLKLWGILETLTGEDYKNYDVLIKRILFLYKDDPYEKQKITYLREYRNAFVHEDSASDEMEAILYQAKNYVERLLIFHLFNPIKFSGFEKAIEFLDLPMSKTKLEEEINIRKEVINKYLPKQI